MQHTCTTAFFLHSAFNLFFPFTLCISEFSFSISEGEQKMFWTISSNLVIHMDSSCHFVLSLSYPIVIICSSFLLSYSYITIRTCLISTYLNHMTNRWLITAQFLFSQFLSNWPIESIMTFRINRYKETWLCKRKTWLRVK